MDGYEATHSSSADEEKRFLWDKTFIYFDLIGQAITIYEVRVVVVSSII